MTAPARVIWHGDLDESFGLINAISHNCTCEVAPSGIRTATCAAHRLLNEDQRALDGLLAYRHMRAALLREEGVAA